MAVPLNFGQSYLEQLATTPVGAGNVPVSVQVDTNGNAVGVGAGGAEYTTLGGASAVAVAAATSANTVVKASPGRLCKVLITATGTNPLQIFDNATTNSGTVIGAFAASPAVGTVIDFQMPAANGITVAGNAANPGFTVSYY